MQRKACAEQEWKKPRKHENTKKNGKEFIELDAKVRNSKSHPSKKETRPINHESTKKTKKGLAICEEKDTKKEKN
ncbi:MAG: hypothetical protein OEZ20_05440 [candidate division WOR-3 bacterium]|nr:hypothetical protein [candidate division WOR-3 bacterium]MDH5683889.1 hypothetical protein [candidate division WOR-3 bacterium]